MKPQQIVAMREYYETLIADSVLKNKEIVIPTVDKISKGIIELIDINLDVECSLYKENASIDEEMYNHNYFGRIEKFKNFCNTPLKTFKDLRNILADPNSPLELVMHVHVVFMGKVYDKLPHKIPSSFFVNASAPITDHPSYAQKIAAEICNSPNKINEIKCKVVENIFVNELFFKKNKIDRSRQLKNEKIARTNIKGIVRTGFFEKISGKNSYEYLRAADLFEADPTANWTIEANKMNLPLVAGPSGNAGGAILSAIMLGGGLSQEEMQDYGLAIISYLLSGGNHGFAEIGCVFEKVGIPHTMGKYLPTLPKSYLASSAYDKVKQKFATLLQDNIQQKRMSNTDFKEKDCEEIYAQFTEEIFKNENLNKANSTCVYNWKNFDEIGQQESANNENDICKKKTKIFPDNLNESSALPAKLAAICYLPKQLTGTYSQENFTDDISGNSFYNLVLFLAAKIGLYQYPPVATSEPVFDFTSCQFQSDKKEGIANKILQKKMGKTLDENIVEIVGGRKLDSVKFKSLKKLLTDIINKEAPAEIQEKYEEIKQYQNQHLRSKEFIKLARKYHKDDNQYNGFAFKNR